MWRDKKIKTILVIILGIAAGILMYVLIEKSDTEASRYIGNKEDDNKTIEEKLAIKIKSANLSTDYVIEQVISDIDKFEFNTINVPVVIEVKDLSSSDMTINKDSKDKAIKLIKKLKGKKINVILEAYPWIDNGSKIETDWLPSDIEAFFENWRNKVLRELVSDIAVPYKVYAVNVASNFVKLEGEEEQWCETIDYVRKDYKGLVTYRINRWDTAVWEQNLLKEYEKKLNYKYFSKVDFISVAAYFGLTNKDTNTTDELAKAIECTTLYDRKQNVKQELKNFYDKWKKPIFFGELGFPKTNGASIAPYDCTYSSVINSVEQAHCFEAYRQVFEKEVWILGFSVFAIGENSDSKKYYPSDESKIIIRDWYKK